MFFRYSQSTLSIHSLYKWAVCILRSNAICKWLCNTSKMIPYLVKAAFQTTHCPLEAPGWIWSPPTPAPAFPHKSMKLSFPFQWLSDFGRVLQGSPWGRGLLLFVEDQRVGLTVTFLTCWMDFLGLFFLSFSRTCFRKGSGGLLLEFPWKCIFSLFPISYLLLISSSAVRNSETVAFARLIAFHGSSPSKKGQNKIRL